MDSNYKKSRRIIEARPEGRRTPWKTYFNDIL